MVVGCGIDTEERLRFSKHLSDFEQSEFISMIFTELEKDCFKTFDVELCVPIAFCFKEAMFKALGNSWTTSGIDWKDLEIIFKKNPTEKEFEIKISGKAAEMLADIGNPQVISNYEFNDETAIFEIILNNE
ncbi:MAG: 4'-phosphopantetheinyl transferase superfamily protein [Bacteroidetes bacterium]|nr:4'-phosphopantetheinyl transferase superfamily protein [Bacteroidota bacterium]